MLSEKDLETLGSLSVIVKSDGKFLSLEKNLKRTFELAARIWGVNFKLDTCSESYKDFLAAKAARNCLTYPKTFYETQITDQDMYCYTVTGWWVQEEFSRLFKMHLENLKTNV
ncbi:MAG: hypothetical protein E6Q83_02515 [Thiothrix sp.]|nr:MAG: hypothetical protein E6Q83_02515 [Thiothrix sp.]